MNIKSIDLVLSDGPDYAYFKTDLPPSIFPWESSPDFELTIAHGHCEEYIKKIFLIFHCK